MVGAILDILERDMIAHPENIQPLSQAWMTRMKDLVGHINVDLDEMIEGDVEITADETHADKQQE